MEGARRIIRFFLQYKTEVVTVESEKQTCEQRGAAAEKTSNKTDAAVLANAPRCALSTAGEPAAPKSAEWSELVESFQRHHWQRSGASNEDKGQRSGLEGVCRTLVAGPVELGIESV